MNHLLTTIVFLITTLQIYHCEQNNVCKTYADYFRMNNNSNCWYDPDADKDVPEIMRNHRYPLEVYNATTDDGYILTIFRMVRNKAKEVFILEPPMSGTAANYMRSGNGSLAFALFDAGYDVWLPNSRGTYYSRGHKSLDEYDDQYWDFSFHELGIYDFPKEIELVASVTGRRDLILVGYSMGGTAGFVYATKMPQHAAVYVKVFVAVGPTIFAPVVRIPFFPTIAPLPALWRSAISPTVFGSYEISKKFLSWVCKNHSVKIYCSIIMSMNAGGTALNLDPAMIPRLYSNSPTRVAIKILEHYHQMGESDRFQEFDYGPVKNLMRYGSDTPPRYPIENVSVPVYIIYGEEDRSCSPKQVDRIYTELPNIGRKYGKHMIKSYNHVDFLYAKTFKAQFVDHLINFTKRNF